MLTIKNNNIFAINHMSINLISSFLPYFNLKLEAL